MVPFGGPTLFSARPYPNRESSAATKCPNCYIGHDSLVFFLSSLTHSHQPFLCAPTVHSSPLFNTEFSHKEEKSQPYLELNKNRMVNANTRVHVITPCSLFIMPEVTYYFWAVFLPGSTAQKNKIRVIYCDYKTCCFKKMKPWRMVCLYWIFQHGAQFRPLSLRLPEEPTLTCCI